MDAAKAVGALRLSAGCCIQASSGACVERDVEPPNDLAARRPRQQSTHSHTSRQTRPFAFRLPAGSAMARCWPVQLLRAREAPSLPGIIEADCAGLQSLGIELATGPSSSPWWDKWLGSPIASRDSADPQVPPQSPGVQARSPLTLRGYIEPCSPGALASSGPSCTPPAPKSYSSLAIWPGLERWRIAGLSQPGCLSLPDSNPSSGTPTTIASPLPGCADANSWGESVLPVAS